MSTFALPDLGEGLDEAEIVAWHVAVGDNVVADQPLVSVETDKAVVEIPSPQAGRIARLVGAPGDVVKVGSPLVQFDDGMAADTGTVVGAIPTAAETPAPRPRTSPRAKAAPAVRALAQRLGVDLTAVAGTGPSGAISRADVEAAAAGEPAGGEALKGSRRAMARNMARAGAVVVPATVSDEADVDAWLTPDADVTLRLLRAIVAGCTAAPALNAWFDGERMSVQRHERINVGLAVDTGEGLVVPVLSDVAGRDAGDLRARIQALKSDAVARRLAPADLRGATITLSNFGTLAGRFAAMVVTPPQVAILGAGRASARVVAVDGAPAVHRLLPLSLTFDHRAVTGSEAAAFLAAVIDDLARPD